MSEEYDDGLCERCHASVATDDGCEPTPHCHMCAQEIVDLALNRPNDFWSLLRTLPNGPSLIAALLRAAPKVAGPWEQDGAHRWARTFADDSRVAAEVLCSDGVTSWTAWPDADALPPKRRAHSVEGRAACVVDAMCDASDALRAAGWLLVNGGGE